MLEENVEKIRTLNPFQTELLKEIFRDQEFNPREYMKPGEKSYTPEQTVRWNLSQIYEKLGVPDDVPNTQKREWVVKEYSEAYEYEFQREEWEAEQASQRLESEPEIFIKPPDPIPLETEAPLNQSEPIPATPQPTPRSAPTQTQSGPSCFEASLIVLFAVALFIIGLFLGTQFEHDNYGFLGLYFSSPTAEPSVPDPILLVDGFDGAEISPQWVVYGNPPELADGLVNSNPLLGLSAGDNMWVNYTIYSRILINACGYAEEESTIGVRLNEPIMVPAFKWNPCNYQPGSVIDVVIVVQGNEITVSENGTQLEPFEINVPDHEVGGVVLEVWGGSAVDYFMVIGLP